MLKIRQSRESGIPISGKDDLNIETGPWTPRGCFSVEMPFYQNVNSHYKDEIVVWPSYFGQDNVFYSAFVNSMNGANKSMCTSVISRMSLKPSYLTLYKNAWIRFWHTNCSLINLSRGGLLLEIKLRDLTYEERTTWFHGDNIRIVCL